MNIAAYVETRAVVGLQLLRAELARLGAYRSAGSIFLLGDSLTGWMRACPTVPQFDPVYMFSINLPALNANGVFITQLQAEINNPQGNGTIRFYVADSSMTWQANGEAEGARVIIGKSGHYVLRSSGANSYLYLGLVTSNKPTADASNVLNVTGIPQQSTSGGCTGYANWVLLLCGNMFQRCYNYAIGGIKGSQWLDNSDAWENLYTDVTVSMFGTNDIGSMADVQPTIDVIAAIAKKRQAIGSRFICGCVPPNDNGTQARNQAYAEFNLRLKVLSKKLGFDTFDTWQWTASITSIGKFDTGMALDGTHFSGKGSYRVAARGVKPLLLRHFQHDIGRPAANITYDAVNAPYGNLLTNGVLAGTAGTKVTGRVTGTVPNTYGVNTLGGTVLTAVSTAPDDAAPVLRTDGQPGKFWQLAIDNTGGVDGEYCQIALSAFINAANYAAGDLLVLEGELVISATGNGVGAIQAYWTHATPAVRSYAIEANTVSISNTLGNFDGDIVTIPFRANPMRVQAGATNLQFVLNIIMLAGGQANAKLAQNLTLRKAPANLYS